MSKYYDIPLDPNNVPTYYFVLSNRGRLKPMTNYDYIMSKMTPIKLAQIYSEMQSCKKCPKRETYKHCFMQGNYDKKCSSILLDWLMQQHYDE